MSYSFRDKPRTRLSDRLRGKSGDELLQEMRQEFDKDRKTFFDTNPNWGFTPAGSAFPRRHVFDDDDDEILRSHRGGRSDLRAHLDDLARRHPEFADHLRSPPGWVSDFQPGSGSSRYSSGSSGDTGGGSYYHQAESGDGSVRPDQPRHQGTGQQQPTDSFQEHKAGGSSTLGRDHLSQHGLRNTDPEIGLKGQAAAKEDRNQRSMSAPPDGRSQQNSSDKPQRFVSKIEINPVNPATGETAASSNMNDNGAGKPPMAPPKSQPSSQQQSQQHKQSTVRHIPIFVEGRDEPVLPKNVDQDIPAASSKHSFQSQPPPNQQQFHQQQYNHPQQTPPQRKPQQPPQPQHEQPKPQEQKSNESFQQSQPTTEKKQKIFNNDPIFQVQQIQKEVDELRKKIDVFVGSNRTDKEYMYLDEMLTRQLIKLDNIETDGKENVRAARKETIRSIQQCISVLESKVPQTPVTANPSQSSIATDIDIDNNSNTAKNNENETDIKSDSKMDTQTIETNQSENNMVGKQVPMDQSDNSQQKDVPADPANSVKSTVSDPTQTNPTEVKC